MAVVAVPKKWGKVFRLWTAAWSPGTTDTYSQADAEAAAADFEVFACHFQQLGGTAAARSTLLDQMKAASGTHNLAVAVYVNGTFVSTGKNPDSGAYLVPAYHPSFVAGSPYLVDSGDTWLMDPTSRQWSFVSESANLSLPDDADDRRATKFGTTNADGVMIDNLGWGVVGASYNDRATGANPPVHGAALAATDIQTGNTWVSAAGKAKWTGYTAALAASFSGAYGRESGLPVAVYVNGAHSGARWFDADGPTSTLAATAMLLMFEGWLRDAGDAVTAWTSEATLVADCNAVIDCQNRGRGALCWTKVWDTSGHTHTASSADDDGDSANIVAWHRFSLGAFLLATNGRSFYHFRHDNGARERIPKDRWWTAANNMGWFAESFTASPTQTTGGITDAPCKRTGGEAGLYRREFANGVVYVNPTAAAITGTFPVAGTYADVDATQHTNSASISAHSARVLSKV